jgi:hypothetical protein
MDRVPSSVIAMRRRVLLASLGAGFAGMLPARAGKEAPPAQPRRMRQAGNGAAAVPPRVISLADHGGGPGATPQTLVRAFGRAFSALAAAGGGTLFVPPGLYDFGPRSDADPIVLCRNARDIAISAYGATFRAATRAKVMPSLFYFFNFSNVTIAGASFIDEGFTPWTDWQGMYCVGLQADEASSGFHMVDCYAERVVGMLASNNNAATRRHLAGVSVHGEIRNAYYGVGANHIRERVDVDLVCHNVRRAFIAYSLKDGNIAVRVSSSPGWPGSNGLVALVSNGASEGNVENVRVQVDVTGTCIHASYVHFYHQGPERQGSMREVDATVNITEVDGARNMFTFDHETEGILRTTSRSWDRIALHGKVRGPFTGTVVSNPSVSAAPGIIYIDRNLAALMGGHRLGVNFRVRP